MAKVVTLYCCQICSCCTYIHSPVLFPCFIYLIFAVCWCKFPYLIHPENFAVGREFELGLSGNLMRRVEHSMDVSLRSKGSNQKNLPERALGNLSVEMDKGKFRLFSESPSGKVPNETVSLTGINMNTDSQTESREFEGSNRFSRVSDINNVYSNDAENLPSLELGLKRLRADKDMGTTAKDDRNVLRRSNSSAFSRYIYIEESVL